MEVGSTMRKLSTTYRFVVRIGPTYVHAGITDDLERSRSEAKAEWPKGTFFQVGDKTNLDEAQLWVTKNAFTSGGSRH
jgi:hypothetical protein